MTLKFSRNAKVTRALTGRRPVRPAADDDFVIKNSQVQSSVVNYVPLNLQCLPDKHLTSKHLNSNIVTKSAATAENIWALKSVLSGYSNSSCDDFANNLKAMCPDSQITKDFKFGRLKLMYFVNHGVGPYFKQLLDAKLEKVSLYSLSFDERLNEITQKSVMVVMVQYWIEEEIKLRYVT